jgi:hypothetical protein
MAESGTKSGSLGGIRGMVLAYLAEHPEGCIFKEISRDIKAPATTIRNALTFLKSQNLAIHNPPVWESGTVESTPIKVGHSTPSGNTINLHNLSFVIKLIRKPYWWSQRTNKLLQLKSQPIQNIHTGRYIYQQFSREDYVVQCHKESIIVILRKALHGTDAYDCLISGIDVFMGIYAYIEKLFDFRFFEDGVPQAMIRSQHTVKLYDAVAKRCKRTGSVFEVWHDGKLRMYIDSSHPTGIEAIQREYSTEDIDRYSRVVEDYIVNNPPMPSELARHITMFLQSQAAYAVNIQEHIGAIKTLGDQVKRMGDILEKLEEKQ